MMTETTLTRYMPVKKDGSLLPHRVLKVHPGFFTLDHENQCQINHAQTLDKIAERGGLSIDELLAVLLGVKWDVVKTVEIKVAHMIVQSMINAYSFGMASADKPDVNPQPDWSKLPKILEQHADHHISICEDVTVDRDSRNASATNALFFSSLFAVSKQFFNESS